MQPFEEARRQMVNWQLKPRGITDSRLLQVMGELPRELFVPESLAEFAYADVPLPVRQPPDSRLPEPGGQLAPPGPPPVWGSESEAIAPPPYLVARMIQEARVVPGHRVLLAGIGCGYAAAVLARLGAVVYGVDPRDVAYQLARARLDALSLEQVRLQQGPMESGWPEHGPYDVILVLEPVVEVPEGLVEQLADGGRLLAPIGEAPRAQELRRLVRRATHQIEQQALGTVQLVPRLTTEGASQVQLPDGGRRGNGRGQAGERPEAAGLIRACAEPLDDIDSTPLGPLLERIGDARVVLLGEASHGTSEFYRMRARITRELILRRGFRVLAIEADWPDAAEVDRYVRHGTPPQHKWVPFGRFPSWMWRNLEVEELVQWLRAYNEPLPAERRVSLHGLDLYSLFVSRQAVIDYLDDVDPDLAELARQRYGCLSPWESDPITYGRAVVSGRYRSCEQDVTRVLTDLLQRRLELSSQDGERYLEAEGNARLVTDAERYYRSIFYGAAESWNLRDQHMFDTLQALLKARGPDAKVVVWAHNSHLGDARATEMGARGEHNLGQLCRVAFGQAAYHIGFGTDHGTVAAASGWGRPMQVMDVPPAHPQSYERLCHESELEAFLLPLREPPREALREVLKPARLERAIGVIYRPDTELQSHYFQAVLPRQFDEYVWFDETRALQPVQATERSEAPETYPFGL